MNNGSRALIFCSPPKYYTSNVYEIFVQGCRQLHIIMKERSQLRTWDFPEGGGGNLITWNTKCSLKVLFRRSHTCIIIYSPPAHSKFLQMSPYISAKWLFFYCPPLFRAIFIDIGSLLGSLFREFYPNSVESGSTRLIAHFMNGRTQMRKRVHSHRDWS